MDQQIQTILYAGLSALVTGFAQWVLYFRKNRAAAAGAEKSNDRTEIENLKLIAQEWREAAVQWKEMADEYQDKAIKEMRKLEEMEEKVRNLEHDLRKANRRISELEKTSKS